MISNPISLSSACLACWPRRVGSASSRSARAMLSGSSSRISMNSSDWMRFTSLAGMRGRLLVRQNEAGLGAPDGKTEEAGRVAGMYQESVVDSHSVSFSAAGQELGVLAGDDSKGSDESDAGSNGGTPGEHTSVHDKARYNMRAPEHEDKRARGCNYLGTSTEVG